jgi:hypothetical protein
MSAGLAAGDGVTAQVVDTPGRTCGGETAAGRVVGVALALSVLAAVAGCAAPGEGRDPFAARTSAERLAALTIRPDTAATAVPADDTVAFEIQGDPAIDIPLGSRCPVRSLVVSSAVHHAHGDTGGLCRTPLSGDWSPLLGGPVVHDPSALDVGYAVPLADAWRSGAGDWSGDRRHQFALDYVWERKVVTSGEDARGDRTPDAWQPAPADRCAYAAAWIDAKWAWSLSVTRAEHDALAATVATCPAAVPGSGQQ